MRDNYFIFAVILFLLLVGCSQQETLTKAEDNASYLDIPTKESASKDGYPTNENKQTYCPNMGELMLDESDEAVKCNEAKAREISNK
ncbi:hypothetical protein [Lysinibacillus sp. NPDC086135]|uniref:hypothetical protein n=1 Tax=Lysinibacillus sp. NPDC086135 TaxID=3364130 RepID=UPI00381F6980